MLGQSAADTILSKTDSPAYPDCVAQREHWLQPLRNVGYCSFYPFKQRSLYRESIEALYSICRAKPDLCVMALTDA